MEFNFPASSSFQNMRRSLHQIHFKDCCRIVFLSPAQILPHEEIIYDRRDEVIGLILDRGAWTIPIAIDTQSLLIMDGHHRRAAAIKLKLARVPCLLLSYDNVSVDVMHPDQKTSVEDIIARGKKGDLFPAKTTRHNFSTLPSMRPIKLGELYF